MFGLIATAAVVSATTACSSGRVRSLPATSMPTLPANAPKASGAPSSSTTPTTVLVPAAQPTTAAAARPLAGYDDTTPPPAVHATGTNYPAIAASLENYRAWLLAHHPDSALAADIYQQGTIAYDELVVILDGLRAQHQTYVTVDRKRTYTFSSISIPAMLMTLRMHEVLTEERTLDRNHQVVKAKKHEWPNNYVVVMTHDYSGRWRIADVTDILPEPTIPL